jgi:hypothetical protein
VLHLKSVIPATREPELKLERSGSQQVRLCIVIDLAGHAGERGLRRRCHCLRHIELTFIMG